MKPSKMKLMEVPGTTRKSVIIYTEGRIDFDELARNNYEVEYNTEISPFPQIKTSHGTIIYRKNSIMIRNPYIEDIPALSSFALSKLDSRRIKKTWLEFQLWWNNEKRELNEAEKRIIRWLKNG